MMKSLALNAVIAYILFKSSLSELVLAKLPLFLQRLGSFEQLRELIAGFAWKSSRMSRRMAAVVIFVAALWILKKIW